MSLRAIESFLHGEFRDATKLIWQDRNVPTPLNLLLDHVEDQGVGRHRLCWAYGATPELSCFPHFDPAVVVYSPRFVELSGLLRMAIMGPFAGELRREVLERLLLKTVAELALRHGDPEFAVEAILGSTVDHGVGFLDHNKLLDLEAQPKNAAYMAVWFYGLAHEYGHVKFVADGDQDWLGAFSLERVAQSVDHALDLSRLPDRELEYGRQRAREDPRGFCLGLEHIHEEAMADVFAASVLLGATSDVMTRVGLDFDAELFLQELVLARAYVFSLRQCRLLAQLDAHDRQANKAREMAYEAAFLSTSLHARSLVQRVYLEWAVAGLLGEPTRERREFASKLIQRVESRLAGVIGPLNDAHDNVTRLVLLEEQRKDDGWSLLERFRQNQVAKSSRIGEAIDIQPFLKLARRLNVRGKLLDALESVVRHPHRPIDRDIVGDIAFFVPFVRGQDVWQPFGLDTRHGHMVFVFTDNGALFEAFFAESANALKAGFSLEAVTLAAARPEKIPRLLASAMPSGKTFASAVQGTRLFDDLILELANDTIWPPTD